MNVENKMQVAAMLLLIVVAIIAALSGGCSNEVTDCDAVRKDYALHYERYKYLVALQERTGFVSAAAPNEARYLNALWAEYGECL